MRVPIALLHLPIFCLLIACQQTGEDTVESEENTVLESRFELLDKNDSGITFFNELKEDSVINYFTYPYLYMGGGVAVGDVNGDGLQDLFFTGNMVENKLFLNKGELKFTDITSASGVAGDTRWVTGANMVDVNGDGLVDIYVSVSGKFETTENLLYINNGLDNNGVPVFEEQAKKYGIADNGHSTQGTFFDYDLDGDLDLYVANYPYTSFKAPNSAYKFKVNIKEHEDSDRLYRNEGGSGFTDVTKESGLLNFGLSLSATVGDVNQDGWPDIYVSNDFASPDYLFLNNGDGTFTDQIKESAEHIAFFGMGVDIADYNNDGLLDIIQMDMVPEDNRRNKANMASMNPNRFWEIVNYGMHYQYMQNVLQLNNGIDQSGVPHYSEVSQLAGVSFTDWSWASLFADLDNDGWKDIFITNGTRKDINNKDYFHHIDEAIAKGEDLNHLKLSKEIPHEAIDNYVFKNNGDLTFENMVDSWGLNFKGYSNGAAYADLDNDGDLEVIVNNIDDYSVIYENISDTKADANYLRFDLNGPSFNPAGLGTKIKLYVDGKIQFQEHTNVRGFQSSVEPLVHFGLGGVEKVDSVEVTWPDKSQVILTDIKANQVLIVDHSKATKPTVPNQETNTLFSDVTEEKEVDYFHFENEYNDFKHQVLLPHIYSRNGPALTTGDVNGDGLEDFFVGGASGHVGAVNIQKSDGSFVKLVSPDFKLDKSKEDIGALLFDADGDADLDLYVVSGGSEFVSDSKEYRDRLYLNNGKGQFKKSVKRLPVSYNSGSRVKAADYDNDGDLDLFVGGRLVPRSYPMPASSLLLRNDSNGSGDVKFTDVTSEMAPDLNELGLVTDAVWSDFNNDNQMDLVVVGEWMPITCFENRGGKFSDVTKAMGLEETVGWWYSIEAADMDKDGDMDFVAGNLGLNYKYKASREETFDVYVKDYDENGQIDIVLGYYNEGIQYPVRGRQCSSEQIPAISIKYEDYNSFAEATLEDIYTPDDLEASLHYQAQTFASSYIENIEGKSMEVRALPNNVQISSINDVVIEDFNSDGHLDIVVAGNMYFAEVETTRNDASFGSFLAGDGQGGFTHIPYSESGFYIKGDVKGLDKINTVDGVAIVAALNNSYVKLIGVKKKDEKLMAGLIE